MSLNPFSRFFFFCLAIAIVGTGTSSAQMLITGIVQNNNDQPLSFASIGIQGTYIGTISEENGEFEIKIPPSHEDASLTFSMVGYVRKSIQISSLRPAYNVIRLEEQLTNLDEVVVKAKRIKPKISKVGSTKWNAGRFMTDSTYAGSAIAQKFTARFDTTYLHYINIGYENSIENLNIRIKLKAVDKAGLPGQLLYEKEIIEALEVQDGFQKIDLKDHFIEITENQFFVEIEPLIVKQFRRQFHLRLAEVIESNPASIKFDDYGEIQLRNHKELKLVFVLFKVFDVKSNQTYYRTSSFGPWEKSETLSLEVGISR